MKTSSFNGFPPQAIQFLVDLRQNNQKNWFEAHKTEYQTYLQEPAQQFAIQMARALEKIPPLGPVQHSIERIYRDLRFSHDKTPYNTHLAIWCWQGECPKYENSGYYFYLEPPKLMLAAGVYIFAAPLLNTYRSAVVDSEFGSQLTQVITAIQQKGPYTLSGLHYKKIPRGYDPNHPRAALLLHNGLYISCETEIPAVLYSTDLIGYCLEKYRDMSPLHSWITEMLALPE